MSGEESVAGIGVGLDLDISGWSANIEKAKQQLDGLTKSAQGATISVPLGARQPAGAAHGRPETPPLAVSAHLGVSRSAVSALRVQANQHMRTMAQAGQAVQVPIQLGRVPYAAMRNQIARGIGEVPVRIRLDPVGVQGIKSVLTAVLTQTAAGARSPAALAAATDMRIPRRAVGGPVISGQPYYVGERGREVFVPRSAGGIIPHAMSGARVADRMSKEQLDFVGNLRRLASQIMPHHAAGGQNWYADAGAYGRAQAQKYGMEQQKALGILAALSAGTSWTGNKTKFERVLHDSAAGKPFPYSMNFNANAKASAILGGQDPLKAFATSPKVGQFYRGLSGDMTALTLDRWATRSTTLGALDQPPKSMRPSMEAAWKKVAKEHGWSNSQFQAALWLLEKENSARGPGQMPMGLWSGGRAEAYRATIEQGGGTFGPGGVQPSRGYAVAIGKGPIVPEDDRLAFIRAYHKVARMGAPNVGTWRHEGEIYVDPAAVKARRDQANDIARRHGEIAFYDITHGEDVQTQRRRRDPSPGQVPFGLASGGRVDYDSEEAEGIRRRQGRRRQAAAASDSSNRIDKLKAMATQLEQSPNEASIARRMLHERGVEGYQHGGHVRKNPKVNRQVLYSLRWPNQAQNRHYGDMEDELGADRYRPDYGGDESESWGSPMGEPRLWLGGLPHRVSGGAALGKLGQLFPNAKLAGLERFANRDLGLMAEAGEQLADRYPLTANKLSAIGFDRNTRRSETSAGTTSSRLATTYIDRWGQLNHDEGGPFPKLGNTYVSGGAPSSIEFQKRVVEYARREARFANLQATVGPTHRESQLIDPTMGGIFTHEFAHAVDAMHGNAPRYALPMSIVSEYAGTNRGESFAELFTGAERNKFLGSMTEPTFDLLDKIRAQEKYLIQPGMSTTWAERKALSEAEHRWAGGVARIAKDRLPRGFRFAFTKVPGTVGSLFSPDQDNPEYKKPLRMQGAMLGYKNQHGGRSRPVADFAVNVVDNRGKVVAVAPWGFMQERGGPDASWLTAATDRESHSRAYLHPHMTKVAENMQGKGLATAMYMASEAFSGVSTKPSGNQLAGGAGLWAQPNRPFGKRYGDIPATGGHPAYYDTKFDLERTKKTNKKRAALGLPQSDTTFLETLVKRQERERGAAMAPFVSNGPIGARIRAREAEAEAEAMITQAVLGRQSDVGGRLSNSVYTSNSGRIPEFGTQFGMRAQRRGRGWWQAPDRINVGWQKRLGFAGGGQSAPKGLYIVNEIGREKFVPKHLEGLIPADVARQIPGGQDLAQRLAMGRYAQSVAGAASGIMDIPGPEQLWKAPGDGWIIPNKFIGRIPHRDDGGPLVTQDAAFGSPEPKPKKRKKPQLPGQINFGFPAAGDRTDITGGPTPALGRPTRTRAITQAEVPVSTGLGVNPASVLRDQAEAATAYKEITGSLASFAAVEKAQLASHRASVAANPERLARQENLQNQSVYAKLMRGLTGTSNAGGFGIGIFGGQGRARAKVEYTRLSEQYQAMSPDRTRDTLDALGEEGAGFEHELKKAKIAVADYVEYTPQAAKATSEFKNQLKLGNAVVAKWTGAVQKNSEQTVKAQGIREQADKALAASKGGAASQFVGIQVAGLSYQIGMQVAGFLASAATDVMKPFADVMTGFTGTTERVTAALAQQLPENGGQLGVTFAKAAATAGISGPAMASLQGILGSSVQAKGAAVAQGQASDLFRAAAGVSNAPTGLTGGYGGVLGSALFAQQLGGGKGYEEQIAGDVSALGGPASAPITQGVSGGYGGLAPFNFGALATTGLNGIYDPRAGYSNVKGPSGQSPLGIVSTEIDSTTAAAKRYQQVIGSATKVELRFFDAGQKGLDEQAKALGVASDAGDAYAKTLANQGIGWFVNGQVAGSAQQLTAAQQQAANGVNIPDQAAITASLQPQLKAQMAQMAASTAFAVGGAASSGSGQSGLIGGEFGLQLAANPLQGAGPGGAAASAASGVALGFQKTLGPQIQDVQNLQTKLTQQAQQGITDMTAVVAQNMGPSAAAQFTQYVGQVTGAGQAILGITEGLANQQAAVGAAQYGNSLRIINRSISDAQGMISGKGATSGAGANLGAVQRLQFELGQQSQQLAVAQSQRQINFSVAAAGFQAPGQTGEQRAANIAEAKYEASIAQKQLNIQKQQIPLAATTFNVGAARSLVDLEHQKQINAQEYALSQEQVIDQKKVNALQAAMALSQQRAQKILDGAVGNWDSALSIAAQAAAQYGYDLDSILNDIRLGIDKALGINPGATGGGGGGTRPRVAASGLVFNTTGATQLTMGEAGTEHVAVLRNPRAMTLGAPSGGGGAISVTVQVSGNTVRSDADIDTLVRRTAAAVEQILNKRGALLGLRSLG